MNNCIVVLFLSALLIACDPGSSNLDHADNKANTNSASNASTLDHNSMGHGAMQSDMQSSSGAASAPYDLQFIDTMVVHHQGAVDMAMLAEKQAHRPELKELAANIIGDQEREIASMSEWRDRWFPEKPKAVNMTFPGMSHGMGGMDLKKLKSLNGNEFDIEFLKQMIPHHEGAVEMAKDLQKQDSHLELKDLASDIIKAQQAEIKQMRDWLSEWQSR